MTGSKSMNPTDWIDLGLKYFKIAKLAATFVPALFLRPRPYPSATKAQRMSR